MKIKSDLKSWYHISQVVSLPLLIIYLLLLSIPPHYTTMKSCSFGLFIFATVIFLRCLRSTGAASCHPDDEAGLLAFNSGITRDPSGLLSSWKKGSDCCSWKGVTCISDRVALLELDGRSDAGETFLSGTISPLLAKLQHLSEIYLTNLRKIKGSFPQFLFQLPKLKYVSIQNNRLSGPLPTNIGLLSQLVHFDLQENQFTGPIPITISNLTRLTRLNLGSNRFSGTIPNIFKSVNKLQYLDLSGNGFSGKLPLSIASLARTLWALMWAITIYRGWSRTIYRDSRVSPYWISPRTGTQVWCRRVSPT